MGIPHLVVAKPGTFIEAALTHSVSNTCRSMFANQPKTNTANSIIAVRPYKSEPNGRARSTVSPCRVERRLTRMNRIHPYLRGMDGAKTQRSDHFAQQEPKPPILGLQ